MAISRRAILKLGVSYGTGVINYGNDSIVYERELRKLARNPAFDNFETALKRTEEIISSATLEHSRMQADSNETEVSLATDASSPTPEVPLPNSGSPAASAFTASTPDGQIDKAEHPIDDDPSNAEPTDAQPAAAETPHENPLKDAIEAAGRFRELCSQLALSSLYLQMTNVINTMQEECLPAVDDLANIKRDYNAILNYLQHC